VRHIGRVLAHQLQQLFPRGRLRDDIETRSPQQHGDSLAYHQAVIGEDDAHERSAAAA